MKQLINKKSREQVTVVGPVLDDGRALVQRRPSGCLEVIDVQQLAVVDQNGETE